MMMRFAWRPGTLERLEDRQLLAGDLVGDYGDVAALVVDLHQEVAPLQVVASEDAGDRAYLLVKRGDGNLELWSSDTTTAGTTKLAVVEANQRLIHDRCCAMKLVGEQLFFVVDAVDPRFDPDIFERFGLVELWKYDLRQQSVTKLANLADWHPMEVKNIRLVGDDDRVFVTVGSGGCFTGCNSQLWTSDGTPEGTFRFDQWFGMPWHEPLGKPVRLGAHWYFLGVSGQRTGLWRADPAARSLELIQPFGSDDFEGPDAYGLVSTDAKLFFLTQADGKYALWSSDGTGEGTVVVKDLAPDPDDSSRPWHLTAIGNAVYFVTHTAREVSEIWKSDGTEAGTVKVTTATARGVVSRTLQIGSTLYLTVDLPGRNIRDWALWALRDDELHHLRVFDTSIYQLREQNGELFFWGYVKDAAPQLWASNGTREGTRLLGNGLVDAGATAGATLILGDQTLATLDGDDQLDPFYELTPVGLGTEPYGVTATGDGLFFFAAGLGRLYQSDGTAETTQRILNSDFRESYFDLGVYSEPPVAHIGATTDRTFAFGDTRLWTWDASLDRLQPLAEVVDTDDDFVGSVGVGETLYFVVADERNQFDRDGTAQLWQTDATNLGTLRMAEEVTVHAIDPILGPDPRPPQVFHTGNHLAYLVGQQAWVVDLESQTQTEVPLAGLAGVTTHQGSFYFLALADETLRLWKWDTSTGQATAVTELGRPAPLHTLPEMLSLGNQLYLADGRGGLWTSDGTGEGTVRVADFGSQGNLEHLAEVHGRLFFSAFDELHGQELWASDGTFPGTRLAADIFPGPASSSPAHLAVLGDSLFFAANDGLHGTELWTIPLVAPLVGDLDADGIVGFSDFLVLSANFGHSTQQGTAGGDLDEDGMVTFADFLRMAENFGRRRSLN